jgi:hypothetical protein
MHGSPTPGSSGERGTHRTRRVTLPLPLILSKLGFGSIPIALGVPMVPLALLIKLVSAKADLLLADGGPYPGVVRKG